MQKHFLSAAFAIPLFLLGTVPSMAIDLDVDVNPGIGVYGGYDDDDYYSSRRRGKLKCWEARRLVREHGYRVVDTVKCSGRVYVFEASRRGRLFEVNVNAWTGDVWRR
jgi:hypothetical protein